MQRRHLSYASCVVTSCSIRRVAPLHRDSLALPCASSTGFPPSSSSSSFSHYTTRRGVRSGTTNPPSRGLLRGGGLRRLHLTGFPLSMSIDRGGGCGGRGKHAIPARWSSTLAEEKRRESTMSTASTATEWDPTSSSSSSSSLSFGEDGEGELDGDDQDMDEAAERASTQLAEVFGPHAKLVVKTIDHKSPRNENGRPRRRSRREEQNNTLHRSDRHAKAQRDSGREEGEEEKKDGAAAVPPEGSSSSLFFHASSTFKLLGFMVELASVTGTAKDEVVERCLNVSFQSDIPFIDPRKKSPPARPSLRSSFALTPHEAELKAIIDELRELCRQFSRRLKFSIKHPSVSAEEEEEEEVEVEEGESGGRRRRGKTAVDGGYACRVYQKDEWFVVSRSIFVFETYGSSPRQVLLRALVRLREQFQREMSSPEKWRECLQEAAALLEPRHKKIVHTQLLQEGRREGGVGGGGKEELLMDGEAEEDDKKNQKKEVGIRSLSECFSEREGKQKGEDEEKEKEKEEKSEVERDVSVCTADKVEVEEEGEGGGASAVKAEEEEEEEVVVGGACSSSSSSSVTLPPIGLCTYSGSITIEDQFGNTFTSTARRQRSPLLAYQQACQQTMWAEQSQFLPSACLLDDFAPSLAGSSSSSGSLFCVPSSPPPPPPLLTRLRWQVALLSQSIAQELHLTRAEAIVCVEIKGAKERNDGSGSALHDPSLDRYASSPYAPLTTSSSAHPKTDEMDDVGGGGGPTNKKKKKEASDDVFFVVSVTAMEGTSTLSVASGSGRYRLLLHAYVTALEYLFDAYPDACRVILHHRLHCHRHLTLFPSVRLLREAVEQHDHYSLLRHHRGKWNCVAVLGTLTTALMGHPFQTTYVPPPTAHGGKTDWVATLTVATGEQSAELLVQKSAKTKAEALKRACLEALRENFPLAHAEVIRVHPDVDVSHDTLAKSSKYRSLPREKRVEHIQSLFAMVCAFAEEDLGWFQPRIRFRNTSAELGFPQWVAEFEVTVEEEQERRTVAVSPPHLQSRMAKRILLWRLAEQYFPKELEYYKALKRGDGVNPAGVGEDGGGGGGSSGSGRFLYYKPHAGIAFVEQLFALMAPQHTSLLPFSWTLTGAVLHPSRPRRRAHRAATKGGEEEEEEDHVMDNVEDGMPYSSAMVDEDTSYWGEAETPDRLLQPLRLQYSATVLGNHGDLIISEYKGKRMYHHSSSAIYATSSLPDEKQDGFASFGEGGGGEDLSDTRRQESPVEVLLTALKTASHHLCRAESEAIWTEFETHEPPPVPSTRELCIYLFYALWGNPPPSHRVSSSSNGAAAAAWASSLRDGGGDEEEDDGRMEENGGGGAAARPSGSTASPAYQPVVEVHAMKVGDQWVGTLTLPLLGSLPVARAYGSTKKKCVKDALTLGARICFPTILQYWMKNIPTASELAKEILTEPIVSVLPDAIQKDVHRQLQQETRKVLHPFPMLLQHVFQEHKGARKIRVERTRAAGNEWQCRLYLQWKKVTVEKGAAQLVGFGAGDQPEKSLYNAACAALENLYEMNYSETVKKTAAASGGGGGGGGGRRRRRFPVG